MAVSLCRVTGISSLFHKISYSLHSPHRMRWRRFSYENMERTNRRIARDSAPHYYLHRGHRTDTPFSIPFSDHPRREILFSGVKPGRKSHLLRGEEVYQMGRDVYKRQMKRLSAFHISSPVQAGRSPVREPKGSKSGQPPARTHSSRYVTIALPSIIQ